MELKVREESIRRSDIEEGTALRYRVISVTVEQMKSKLGKPYEAIILRLERQGETYKLQCFNSELNALIKGFGGNTDAWVNQQIDCYNMPTSTGRSQWKLVPATEVESV